MGGTAISTSSPPQIINNNNFGKTPPIIQQEDFGGGGDMSNQGNSSSSSVQKPENVGWRAGWFRSLGNNVLHSTNSIVEKKWDQSNLKWDESSNLKWDESNFFVGDSKKEVISLVKESKSDILNKWNESNQIWRETNQILKVGGGIFAVIATTYVVNNRRKGK